MRARASRFSLASLAPALTRPYARVRSRVRFFFFFFFLSTFFFCCCCYLCPFFPLAFCATAKLSLSLSHSLCFLPRIAINFYAILPLFLCSPSNVMESTLAPLVDVLHRPSLYNAHTNLYRYTLRHTRFTALQSRSPKPKACVYSLICCERTR